MASKLMLACEDLANDRAAWQRPVSTASISMNRPSSAVVCRHSRQTAALKKSATVLALLASNKLLRGLITPVDTVGWRI